MSDNYEKCVLCDIPTTIAVNTPVDNRHFYIEGAGQLCERCWNDVYSEKSNQWQVYHEE
jgi:recombinational DNA repair protein (RecF pathway)